jgi:hypothetical protein
MAVDALTRTRLQISDLLGHDQSFMSALDRANGRFDGVLVLSGNGPAAKDAEVQTNL